MSVFVPQSARTILEVGCGAGAFLRLLERDDRELWGVELNESEARQAEAYCHRVLVGDIMQLLAELPEKHFDCIVFNDVLEHLAWPCKVLEKVRSLLSDDGVVVASIPNIRYIDTFVKEMLWQKDFRYRPEGGILDETHFRFFTSKSMCRMFRSCGYEIVRHEGVRPCKSWKEKLLITCSMGLLSDCRYHCYATVARPQK